MPEKNRCRILRTCHGPEKLYYSSMTMPLPSLPPGMAIHESTVDRLPAGDPSTVRFAVSGSLTIPEAGGFRLLPIAGELWGHHDDTGAPVFDTGAIAIPLGRLPLAETIDLVDASVTVVPGQGDLCVILKGSLSGVFSDSLAVSGTFESPILYDRNDPSCVAVVTLVSTTSLRSGDRINLSGGTVRFTWLSKPDARELISRFLTDEDRELLFQTPCLSLGIADLCGIGDQPVTLGLSCSVLEAGARLSTEIFPSIIRLPVFGPDTTLFMHGDRYDEPATVNLTGRWENRVSSNVFLHLMTGEGAKVVSLLRGTAPLCGTISGKGFRFEKLALEAHFSNGILFPESRWPQRIPDQEIALSVDEHGLASMRLRLPSLTLGSSAIYPEKGEGALIDARVTHRGVRLANVILETPKGDRRREDALLVDGYGEIGFDGKAPG